MLLLLLMLIMMMIVVATTRRHGGGKVLEGLLDLHLFDAQRLCEGKDGMYELG
jgi:hypothetical protein